MEKKLTSSYTKRSYIFNPKDKKGSGAFGEVYKGIIYNTGEVVAIKCILYDQIEKVGPELVAAVGSEVNILQTLMHSPSPYIIKIYDCFKSDTYVYVILEYCDEGTLEDEIKKYNVIPEEKAKIIMNHILQGLNLLHMKGIAHRDIKPENIFKKSGLYKLGDFGFATKEQVLDNYVGTLPYMAPELHADVLQYDLKVDIWALGAVFYQMIFGQLPFRSKIETINSIIKFPATIKVTQECKELIGLMLTKDSKKRPTAFECLNHIYLHKSDFGTLAISSPNSKILKNTFNEYTIYESVNLNYPTDTGSISPVISSNFNNNRSLNKSNPYDYNKSPMTTSITTSTLINTLMETTPKSNNNVSPELFLSNGNLKKSLEIKYDKYLNQKFDNYISSIKSLLTIVKNVRSLRKDEAPLLEYMLIKRGYYHLNMVNECLKNNNFPKDILNNMVCDRWEQYICTNEYNDIKNKFCRLINDGFIKLYESAQAKTQQNPLLMKNSFAGRTLNQDIRNNFIASYTMILQDEIAYCQQQQLSQSINKIDKEQYLRLTLDLKYCLFLEENIYNHNAIILYDTYFKHRNEMNMIELDKAINNQDFYKQYLDYETFKSLHSF